MLDKEKESDIVDEKKKEEVFDIEKNKHIALVRLQKYKMLQKLNLLTIDALIVENCKLVDIIIKEEKAIGKCERIMERYKGLEEKKNET